MQIERTKMKLLAATAVSLLLLPASYSQTKPEPVSSKPDAALILKSRVFEIRTYTTSQKMDVFKAYFIKNTMALFKKYDFEVIGYWIPQDPPHSENTFVYMLAFPDRETAKAKWDAFLNDPEWVKARTDFRAKNGNITDKIESQFVSPVDFSPSK